MRLPSFAAATAATFALTAAWTGAPAGPAAAQPLGAVAEPADLLSYDPSAVAYAAVPAVRPETGPVSYEIFFRTDVSTLDAVAIEKVSIIADAALAGGVGATVILGGADTVGDADYNQQLSAQRAETVRQNLIARGVPTEVVAVEAVGERVLAVPTPDETPELANRRVVVTLDAFGAFAPPDVDRPIAFPLPPAITP